MTLRFCIAPIVLLSLLLTENIFCQSITWQRTYNRTMWYPDCGYDICQSADGNFYIVGVSYMGGIYILKINQLGDTIWTTTSLGAREAYAVTASIDGGCVLTGESINSKSFTMKLNSNGILVWNKEYSGASLTNRDIVTATDGYVFCATDRETTQDGYYAKVDLQGNLLWENYYVLQNSSRFYSSVINSGDGGYVFTGQLDSANFPCFTILMKCDSQGNKLWERKYLLNGIAAAGKTIKRISNGFLIGGRTSDSSYTFESEFILRVDNNGNTINQKVFTSNQDEYFQDISVANQNRYVMSIYREGYGFTVYGKIIVIDSIGSIMREKILNDTGQIVLNSSMCLPNGDIMFVGISEFDNVTREDVYAARTDSNLNVPPMIAVKEIQSQIPKAYKLYQNYPNPFNPETNIYLDIPILSTVKLAVYDMLGREIQVLADGKLDAGKYETKWIATEYPSGVYFVRLEAGNYMMTIKMVLLK